MSDPGDAPPLVPASDGAPAKSGAPQATRDALADEIAQRGWAVGEHSYGRPTVVEADLGGLRIGRYCSIGPNVTIVLGNHRTDLVTTYPFGALASLSDRWPEAAGGADHEARGLTRIGSDVWLAANATILSGVEIGSGAVIGAGALVSRDVPPYAIVAGNPGRVIRFRFPPEAIARLLRAAWWDWPDARVRQAMPLLLGADIEAFLAFAEKPAAPLAGATRPRRARGTPPPGPSGATNERLPSSRPATTPIAPGTADPAGPIARDAGDDAGEEGETGS